MPTTEVTINNKPLSTMGVAMLSGAYAALLTPPSLKEFVENDDPTQNGIDIIVPDSPVVNERDVTLTFLIKRHFYLTMLLLLQNYTKEP